MYTFTRGNIQCIQVVLSPGLSTVTCKSTVAGDKLGFLCINPIGQYIHLPPPPPVLKSLAMITYANWNSSLSQFQEYFTSDHCYQGIVTIYRGVFFLLPFKHWKPHSCNLTNSTVLMTKNHSAAQLFWISPLTETVVFISLTTIKSSRFHLLYLKVAYLAMLFIPQLPYFAE